MVAGKKKTRPSGATPGRVMGTGQADKSGLQFRDNSTMSGPVRQFRADWKAVGH